MEEKTPIKSLKSAHKKTTTSKAGGKNSWVIVVVTLLIVIGGLLMLKQGGIDKLKNIFNFQDKVAKTITLEEAGVVLQNFVDTVYAQNIKNMDILESSEANGIYKFKVKVTGADDSSSESDVYTTKDGKLFLVNPINIDEMMATVAGAAVDAGAGNGAAAQPSANIPKTDTPKVEMFTMSYCPYGNQAEDGMSPVARLLGDEVEIEPHYVVYSNYQGGGPKYCLDAESKYCSMHGVDELKQDVRELCIYKYNKSQFWDYIDAVNKDCNVGNIEECWNGPADDLGIDTDKISTCLDNEAMDILEVEAGLNAKYSVSGSPTIIINGASYSGGRAPENFKLGICGAFNTEPEACATVLGAATAAAAGGCN